MSRWKEKVKACTTCDISQICKRKILPTPGNNVDILFVGDYPSMVDHLLGKSCTGLQGQVFDELIAEGLDSSITYSYINSILCTPFRDTDLDDTRPPSLPEIEGCRVHLSDYIKITKPQIIVALGKIADRSLKKFVPSYHTILNFNAVFVSSHPELEKARIILKLKSLSKNVISCR